ncbi:MAG: MGMT family protein [Thermoanaerobaculaceae bacterium]
MSGTPRRRGNRAQAMRVHGEVASSQCAGAWDAVYAIVRSIPPGRVMTYGQIAAVLGYTLSPKAVGWAMHTCPDDVPWQRVVNAAGGCSTDRRGDLPLGLQRKLLEREGVEFRLDGSVDLERYRYDPGPAKVRILR